MSQLLLDFRMLPVPVFPVAEYVVSVDMVKSIILGTNFCYFVYVSAWWPDRQPSGAARSPFSFSLSDPPTVQAPGTPSRPGRLLEYNLGSG